MGATTSGGGDELLLAPLGFTDVEELVYRALLMRQSATASALGEDVNVSARKVAEALDALERRALVSRLPESRRTYVAVPPEVAIELIAARRHEEIEKAKAAAAQLAARVRAAAQRRHPEQQLEIVVGEEAVAQRVVQIEMSATRELLSLSRPPYVRTTPWTNEIVERMRPVRRRVVYTPATLALPGAAEVIRGVIARGTEGRLLDQVPVKMMMVDQSIALMPLDMQSPTVDEAVVVHARPLLDALAALFETLWERAVLFPGDPAHGSPPQDEDALVADIAAMLAGGMKDDAIARALNVSRSTFERRLRVLMDSLGAKTRFQAGVLAAERGMTGARNGNGSGPRSATRARTEVADQ